MERSDADASRSEAARFIARLEGLLHEARRAAAVGLAAGAPAGTGGPKGPSAAGAAAKGPSPGSGAGGRESAKSVRSLTGLSLYACVADVRQGRRRIVVQLLGEQSLYEGAAESVDWTEDKARIGARAALAALAEWAQERAEMGAEGLQFALGDVIHAPTARGTAVLAAVAVRRRADGGDGGWLLGAAWRSDGGAAAGARAALHACQTYGDGRAVLY